MAQPCHRCKVVHPKGVIVCQDAQRQIVQQDTEDRTLSRQHRLGCEGCPNPLKHMRNIERSKRFHPTHIFS